MDGRASSTVTISCCFLRYTSRELDHKWYSRDSNQHSYMGCQHFSGRINLYVNVLTTGNLDRMWDNCGKMDFQENGPLESGQPWRPGGEGMIIRVLRVGPFLWS